MRNDEETIYGFHACFAAAECRPEAIVKVFLLEEHVPHFSALLKVLARTKRAYKIVGVDELSKLTSTKHHGGISMLLKRRHVKRIAEWEAPERALALALVGVENPHNIGAIARSAAFFGANALIVTEEGLLSGSAHRVAQGALERLEVFTASEAELLALKKGGFELFAFVPQGGEPIESAALCPRTVLLFGAEETGLPPSIVERATSRVTIPGGGRIESLNVSVAAAVGLYAFGENRRRRGSS